LRKILPSNGLGPGLREVGQSGQKVLHLWPHSQKSATLNQKFFFRVQTIRLAASFEPLNSFRRQSCACAKSRAIQLF